MTERPQAAEPGWTAGLSDADLRGAMLRALRLLLGLAVVAAALFWWRAGWASAALVLVGAGVSGASLWEWMRLITAMNAHMDVQMGAQREGASRGRPMGLTLAGFFLRLLLTVPVLYVSLRYLHGTVFGLGAGLLLGLLALTYEALRLLNRWTK